jgi:G3E family GTPase
VVDAKHLPQRLADSSEAADQIAFADVIVLNKTDLVTPAELAEVEALIRRINRFAAIHHATKANVPITRILDQGAFDLNRVLAHSPDFLESDEHEHNEDVSSMSFEVSRPIDPEKFNAWIGELLQVKGPDLLRTKGILAYCNDDRRFAFQAVHMIADGDFIGPWKEGDARRSKIVFIGRNLNRPQLRRGFEACQAEP